MLKPFFTRIILCCSLFTLINCKHQADFERNIAFENDWQNTGDTNSPGTFMSFEKNVELDLQNDKIYILQLSPSNNVLQLMVNSSIISGNTNAKNTRSFNITEQLKKQNTIKLTVKNKTAFKAELHCINKLYIPVVQTHLKQTSNNTNSILVEVKVKNAFNTEKQGILNYTLYTTKNKKLQKKETPVFIAGNSENLYRQEIYLGDSEKDCESIKIVCHLYSEGKLFDKNFDVLEARLATSPSNF